MGRKGLSDFDKEKDVWYYQPKIYVNRQDADSTYTGLEDFKAAIKPGAEEELIEDRLITEFLKEEPAEKTVKRMAGTPAENKPQDSPGKVSETFESGGFFDGKTQLLKDEIADINRNLEKRARIEKDSGCEIEKEIEEVKRHLHEICTWKKGDKSTIEFIRMEFIKQLASLYREKRSNCLSYWKDSVFEKKDRRTLLFEYISLSWTNDLAFEKGTGGEKTA